MKCWMGWNEHVERRIHVAPRVITIESTQEETVSRDEETTAVPSITPLVPSTSFLASSKSCIDHAIEFKIKREQQEGSLPWI